MLTYIIERVRDGGIARAFRHPQYALYQVGSWSSSMSMWIQRICIGWLTWELTHSGAWLGGIALAQSLPQVFLVAFAGALADRSNRLKILRVVEAINGALVIIIAAIIILDLITVELLLGYVILRGVSGTMGVPARVTVAPTLVPKGDLSAAIAVNSVLTSVAAFLGPALAGLLIALLGVGWALAISGCGAAIMVVVLYFVRPLRNEHRSGQAGGLIADVLEGINYVSRHGGIGPVLLLAVCAAILVRPLTDLLPGIVDVVFNQGADGLAVLMSAFGIGGMVGSIWIANRNRMQGTTNLFLMGTLAALGLTFLVSVISSFPIAIAVIAALGLATSMVMNGSQIVIQNSVEGSMRARVMSIYSLNYRAGPSIGAMIMGIASIWVGLQAPVAAGAIILMIIWIIVYRRRTNIINAWRNDRAAREAEAK